MTTDGCIDKSDLRERAKECFERCAQMRPEYKDAKTWADRVQSRIEQEEKDARRSAERARSAAPSSRGAAARRSAPRAAAL